MASTRKKKAPPKVRVKGASRLNRMLEYVVEAFEQGNEGMAARWIYSPPQAPQNSKVLERTLDDYVLVTADDFSGDFERIGDFTDAKGDIRWGDVVLMKIPKKRREELRAENAAAAAAPMQSIQDAYHSSMEGREIIGPDGEKHSATARGSVKVQAREVEIDRSSQLRESED